MALAMSLMAGTASGAQERLAAGGGGVGVRTHKTPLVFVPGITGTSLYEEDTGEEIWPAANKIIFSDDSHLMALELPWNPALHPPINTDIVVGEVIDNVKKSDVYGDLFSQIEAAGYTRGYDFEPVPLDWRRSAEVNGQELLDAIDEVRARTGADKVNVLAHSQGGQVATAALSSSAFDNQGKVDRVVTLGTPFLGAAKALGIIEYEEPCYVEFVGFCFMNKERAKTLGRTWPGFAELLPSPAYDQAVGNALYTVDDGWLNHSATLSRLISTGGNWYQLYDARDLHQAYDYWSPADSSVDLMRVASDGLPTITAVNEVLVEECDWWWFNCRQVVDVEFTHGNGDETVATASASLYAPSRGFDYRGSGLTWFVNGLNHTDLAGDPSIIDQSLTFLETGIAPWGAASTPGDGLSGLELVARGPVQTQVADAEGRVEVADGAEVAAEDAESIPGATVSDSVASQTAFVSEPGEYTTTWTAVERGEFLLRLRQYDDEEVTSVVAYPHVRVGEGDTLAIEHDDETGTGEPTLVIDRGGDGQVDEEVEAVSRVDGDAAADRDAPESSATVTPRGNSGKAHVTLDAEDVGGAGVDRIEYAVESTGEIGVYDQRGPLVLPAEGDLLIRAVDRAGNVEAPRQVVPLDGQ